MPFPPWCRAGVISGTEVRNSLLFTQAHTHPYATLDHAVVLPYAVVQRHARLRRVVIGRSVLITRGLVMGEHPEEDAKGSGSPTRA